MAFWSFLLLTACVEYEFGEDNELNDDPEDTGEIPVDTVPEESESEPEPEEPIADQPVYGHTSGELFVVDPQSGQRTFKGNFRSASGRAVTGFLDIAIDLNGYMFGGTGRGGGTDPAIYRIDPQSAIVTKLCDTDIRMPALAFTSEGVLYAGAEREVTRVDLTTCTGSPLFSGSNYETSGDLVGLPDGFLYWTVKGSSNGRDALVRVDPRTGATHFVGNLQVGDLFGLGYDDGNLYGFGKDGSIVRINPLNAATTQLVAPSSTISWWGATTNPVLWQ